MEYEEFKDKIVGFLENKAGLDMLEQYIYLKKLTNDIEQELTTDILGEQEDPQQQQQEYDDFDDVEQLDDELDDELDEFAETEQEQQLTQQPQQQRYRPAQAQRLQAPITHPAPVQPAPPRTMFKKDIPPGLKKYQEELRQKSITKKVKVKQPSNSPKPLEITEEDIDKGNF